MRVKILLFALTSAWSLAGKCQQEYQTFGKFKFVEAIIFPINYTPGPAQHLSHSDSLLLSLTYEDDDTLYTGLYTIATGQAQPVPHQVPIPPLEGYPQFLQATMAGNASLIVMTVNRYGGWIINDMAMTRRDGTSAYSTPVLLQNLNDPAESDAYPFLSADGERLYFLQNERLMVATAYADGSGFGEAKAVQFEGAIEMPILSIWMDRKEKTMWIVADNRIYRATRKRRDAALSLPAIYTTEFESFPFISGISFNKKQTDMYLYYSDDEPVILHYQLK